MKATKQKIICTIGPSTMNKFMLQRLEKLGVDLFRINLSHTKIDELEGIVSFMKLNSTVPICIDTEGAQIRTGDMQCGQIHVEENSFLKVYKYRVPGNAESICFHPVDVVDKFQVGDFLSIDFNSVVTQVFEKHPDFVRLKIHSGGLISKNKAVTLEREIFLEPFTEKDLKAFELVKKLNLEYVSFSFAHSAQDILQLKALLPSNVKIISKIECRSGLINLAEIAKLSDAILIDRGDLSRQVPIERIPGAQKDIIKVCKALKKEVYVATNLLESMITSQTPTRAEVNDIYNTLSDGADGLVMAAETAVGKFPLQTVNMVLKVMQEFQDDLTLSNSKKLVDYFSEAASSVIPPHGGKLMISTDFLSDDDKKNIEKNSQLIELDDFQLLDIEQLSFGTFSPLNGFMNEDTLNSVLEHQKLENSLPWTMPVLLQMELKFKDSIKNGSKIYFCSKNNPSTIHSSMIVSSTFAYDLVKLSKLWFGTDSKQHPGVKRIFAKDNFFIAGKVSLHEKLELPFRNYELIPTQSRFIFQQKGWSSIVAFHSRNVVHGAHEFIQKQALEMTQADGLLISPVLGPKQLGDFLPSPIMNSYQTLIDFGYYPKNKIILSSLFTYPRYAGPREAVFTALCRKNMGCSHFIVGRDHSGVGGYYKDISLEKYFQNVGEIGIEPVFFNEIAYDTNIKQYSEFNTSNTQSQQSISATEIRNSLLNNKKIPDWLMKDVVQEELRRILHTEGKLFL